MIKTNGHQKKTSDEELKEYLITGSAVDENAKKSVVRSENSEGKPKGIPAQTQIKAQTSALTTEAQSAAQQQFEAMERIAKAAQEEAQSIIQSAQDQIAAIDSESRRMTQQLLKTTKKLQEAIGEVTTSS